MRLNLCCIVQSIFLREIVCWNKCGLWPLFGYWAKTFGLFGKLFSIGFSKLHSTCQEKTFEKRNFSEKFMFPYQFLILREDFSSFAKISRQGYQNGFHCVASENMRNLFLKELYFSIFFSFSQRIFIGLWQNVSGNSFQNWILRVQMKVPVRIFFLQNFPFLLIFGHWAKKYRPFPPMIRQGFQNGILRVRRNSLKRTISSENSMFFFISFGFWSETFRPFGKFLSAGRLKLCSMGQRNFLKVFLKGS